MSQLSCDTTHTLIAKPLGFAVVTWLYNTLQQTATHWYCVMNLSRDSNFHAHTKSGLEFYPSRFQRWPCCVGPSHWGDLCWLCTNIFFQCCGCQIHSQKTSGYVVPLNEEIRGGSWVSFAAQKISCNCSSLLFVANVSVPANEEICDCDENTVLQCVALWCCVLQSHVTSATQSPLNEETSDGDKTLLETPAVVIIRIQMSWFRGLCYSCHVMLVCTVRDSCLMARSAWLIIITLAIVFHSCATAGTWL